MGELPYLFLLHSQSKPQLVGTKMFQFLFFVDAAAERTTFSLDNVAPVDV